MNTLQYIQRQLATHEISDEQIQRALEPHFSAGEVKDYLAGKKIKRALDLGMRMPEVIQDIADAKRREKLQIDDLREGKSRERYLVPRHPGIPGRDFFLSTWSREDFLELCRLSQPELVDGLTEEAIAELPRLD